jgi:hypothetical protein
MLKKRTKRHIKGKSGIGSVPFLENFMSGGLGGLEKYKGDIGKNLLKQDAMSMGSDLANVLTVKAQNKIDPDFNKNNPTAHFVQDTRKQILSTAGNAAFGPLGGMVGETVGNLISIGETALAKDDCVLDPITGEPMIDPTTGQCLKKKNKADALSFAGNVQDFVNSLKNIGKGHRFKDVASSIVASTPLGKIYGIQDDINNRKINLANISSLNRFDYSNQLNQKKAEAMAEANRLQRVALNPAFGTYAKKGAMIPKSKCGCTKDKDGLDTDVFYAMNKKLFNLVLKRINLPENTPYSNKVKMLLKYSVPDNMNLRSYVMSIDKRVADFIKEWEKSKK